ncbi:MAG: 50S ribosomal protein L2, partial [Bacteroidota bacterium]|nr:50S ribosomal protein L2 [Bacteroidota bacterium]
MAVRKLNPVTPGQRHKIIGAFDTITASTPEKSLLKPMTRSGGRNSQGRMTMRYIGGGHKRKYRFIDFKRDKDGIAAVVESIQYDPNRTARIALLVYPDGDKRYMLASNGLKVGQKIETGSGIAPEIGNTLPLAEIPLGTLVHNIELHPS